MQDDLADLMARHMRLDMQAPTHNLSNPPTPQVVAQPAPITYISQHYHHSAHVAPPSAATTTTNNDDNDNETPTSTILHNAGVDTHALLPSQLQLFKNAQPDQQARLIELWRIAPPTYGDQLGPRAMGNWPQTSLEMEEEAARQRWETQEQQRLKNLSVLPSHNSAEPYMKSGYEEDMNMDSEPQGYRPATDPAYNREREWWHMSGEEPIEHQVSGPPTHVKRPLPSTSRRLPSSRGPDLANVHSTACSSKCN